MGLCCLDFEGSYLGDRVVYSLVDGGNFKLGTREM